MSKHKWLTIIIVFQALFFANGQKTASAQDFIYLMPSKEINETGEDLYFKAYLIDRQTFALSLRSRTLYLQIRTASDSIVWSEKYYLLNGRGSGNVYIGEDWPQGEYFMEGYTMSSFTSDSTQAILPRRILVVDRVSQMNTVAMQDAKNDSIKKSTSHHRFDLFPEGGHLVDGIYSVVAFKSTYGNGFPEEVSGMVYEDGKEIAAIKCLHDGMGRFAFTPKAGRIYKVELNDGRTIPFPAVERQGISLRVIKNNPSGITLIISDSDTTNHKFSITAKLNGYPCCNASGMVNGSTLVRLPKEFFPQQGIAEITLMDGDGRPVAERLVYVNSDKMLNITALPGQEQYNRRKMGKVNLQVTDTCGNPIMAELSVSIFDKAYLYQPGHENILSHCFLSEQIRGNVFNPTYYFDPRNEDRLQSLDLLLMTQGWRRFVWDNGPVVGKSLFSDGLYGYETNNLRLEQAIRAMSPNGDTCAVRTDSLGRFEFDPYWLDKMRGDIYLRPLLKKLRSKIAVVDPFDSINYFRQGRPRYIPQNYLIDTIFKETVLKADDGTIAFRKVVVKAKRPAMLRDKLIDYLDSLAIMESGVWVCDCVEDGKSEGYINNYMGYDHHLACGPKPDYSGKRRLPKRGHAYSVCKWEYHGDKWWDVTCKYAPIIYPGPRANDRDLLKIYGYTKAQGYYPKREFYQPDSLDLQSSTSDPRNLLQWQPAVLTDGNGNAEIPFATSDVNSEFIGIVEAIDGNGLMGYQTFSFRVMKK